uniref:DUF1211 domain-containing protein n=1 Tax=Phenylobacterium glaciei TaxID=2803784 RepID=A0A974P4G9_9CAUL|nr:DUF1211 domain-containing protein [Phenylobacterium glaciei]
MRLAALDTRAGGELPLFSGTGADMATSRRAAAKAAHRTATKPAVKVESQDQPLLERLLFFSDAVFAIVLTILVLELRPPEAHTAAELRAGLMAMTPNFVAFAMTFVVISIFWAAQMNTLRPLRQFDWPAAFANLAFLFPICLLPFVTAMLAEARFGALAWSLYSWVLIAASVANVALVLVISRGGGRLTGGMSPARGCIAWHGRRRPASPSVQA